MTSDLQDSLLVYLDTLFTDVIQKEHSIKISHASKDNFENYSIEIYCDNRYINIPLKLNSKYKNIKFECYPFSLPFQANGTVKVAGLSSEHLNHNSSNPYQALLDFVKEVQ
jgi:hypothetical protein